MLERFRATSQMLENTRPSTPLSSPWKPSSRLDFAMEQTKDWNRESAWVSSTVAPAPRRPSGSMPPAWITSAGLPPPPRAFLFRLHTFFFFPVSAGGGPRGPPPRPPPPVLALHDLFA